MDLLLASSEHEWEDWIAKALLPAAEAFGFRVIRLTGAGDSQPFKARLDAALEHCEAAIAIHPSAVEPTAGKPMIEWPLRTIAAMESRPSRRALLLRRPEQKSAYPAEREIACDTADPVDALVQIAAVLGEWYRSPHGRFQLGPAVRISSLLQQFGADRIMAEYRVRTHIGDLTPWRRAIFIREFDRAEVLTPRPGDGGAIQIRIVVNQEVFGETDFTTLDRRVLDLSQPPPETIAPMDDPRHLAEADGCQAPLGDDTKNGVDYLRELAQTEGRQ